MRATETGGQVGETENRIGREDWVLLRDAVCGVRHAPEYYRKLPARLKRHPVARLVKKFLITGREEHLDQAARLLSGKDQGYWLELFKS